jgi:hypothetical protein
MDIYKKNVKHEEEFLWNTRKNKETKKRISSKDKAVEKEKANEMKKK